MIMLILRKNISASAVITGEYTGYTLDVYFLKYIASVACFSLFSLQMGTVLGERKQKEMFVLMSECPRCLFGEFKPVRKIERNTAGS